MPIDDTPLLIRVHTPKGKPLKGTANVEVFHRTRGERVVYRDQSTKREIEIRDLRRGAAEEYFVTVTPVGKEGEGFPPQQQAVSIPLTGTVTLTFVFGEGVRAVRAAVVDSPPFLSPPFIPDDGDEPLPDRYFVRGTVVGPGGAGVGGLRVVLVDRNVGGDVVIVTVLTTSAGRFSAEFDASLVRSRGKRKPDLQAQVHSGAAFLGASAIRYNAGEHEVLDVRIPDAGAAILPSEYDTLIAAIRPHFAEPLGQLEESAERQDVTYLANKTGWDARAVAIASLADRSARAHVRSNGTFEIDAPFFYALFRAGIPADAEALYKTAVEVVERVLRRSLDENIIPRYLESRVPQALEAYKRISSEVRLTGAPPAGVSTLRDMLDVARLAPAEQQTFSRLLTEHGDRTDRLWTAVRAELGDATAKRLEVDGKLASITLNNAPLMRAVHAVEGPDGVGDPVRLAELGFHRAAAWQKLVQDVAVVPQEIPGTTESEKRENYGRYLAAQVRISYPTASVAEMLSPAAPEAAAFLSDHHQDFVIGAQPVEQYLRRNKLTVEPAVVEEVKRAQRLYQLTPTDEAFTGLARSGEIHSAFDVVRQPRGVFVARYANDIGGFEAAELTYDRASEIHNYVLNIAAGFEVASNGFELDFGNVLSPGPKPPTGANADDLIAYPTLEKLLGSMDFCACDHCRSVLSPAAYLVDLLQFVDRDPVDGTTNPQEVLFRRRPDLQHLPLTCENTNVAMPYIDIVNETLEYFIANQVQELSLRDYLGHDTDGSRSEDLLASPQFVLDAAYTKLGKALFPPPLPFHRSLELLRATMNALDIPLPLAMERLRSSDDLFGTPYGWHDILTEELRISPIEYQILTDRFRNNQIAVPLALLYGFESGTSNADVIAALSNAKTFARRTGITYDELVALLRTRFVNPASDLLPRLDKLRMPFGTVAELTTIGDVASVARFDAQLPAGAGALDPAFYGGNIHNWATQNFDRLMTLIVLSTPKPTDDVCNFDLLELRRAKPAANEQDTSTRLDAVAYFRFMRFIRVWRKTGWTMEQVDAALCALSNGDGHQLGDADLDTVTDVNLRLRTFLPRLAVVQRVMKALDLTVEKDLLPLLALWSDIGTHGESSLYRQLFLNPVILEQDSVFAANVQGDYLPPNVPPPGKVPLLSDHAAAVRAALNLTGADYDEIVARLKLDASATLTLHNVSLIFRHGYLARKLRMSVRELHTLIDVTDLDPFVQPDFAGVPLQPPPILRLIDLVQAIRASGLDIPNALYLIWNQDLSGKSAPSEAATMDLARALRGDFADPSLATAERKRQQALQRVSAAAKTDLRFTRAILDAGAPPYPLHAYLDLSRPGIDSVLGLEDGGLALDVYNGPTITANANLTFAAAAIPWSSTPSAPISLVWKGQIEVPEDGSYVFSIETDAAASVSLKVGEPRALTTLQTGERNTGAIELKGNVLYEFELRVEKVKDGLDVQWQTPKRESEIIPPRYLWSPDVIDRFVKIYERFLKVTALATALKLTTGEIAHLGTSVDHQIVSTGWLNLLPVRRDTSVVSISLGRVFRSVLEFVRIKSEVAAKDDQVLRALQNPTQAASIMHWDAASFTALLARFGVNDSDAGLMDVFRRLHDAFAIARTAGVSPQALIASVSNDPSADAVRSLHGALRARHDADDWRTVVKPINDRMRGLQRDALVAYILHHFRGDSATSHIDTTERLFEYFLMDVAMEPCMQTSRIRHALSSVQLFVERCLMSLETHVSSASIDRERWEWMKRYRLWEANRKVFLYPENWLEPELRDDKSPMFEELESALLQSDITEDSAAAAVMNYVAGLEETSKLEPVGICHTPNVDHIIARSSGANRKYYYRRHERRAWTPWEPIKTDIEDNPVLPVVWNGRLLLFWLRITQGTSPTPAGSSLPSSGKIVDVGNNSVTAPIMVIRLVLCWSEYYNGKWQDVRTSNPDFPMEMAGSLEHRRFLHLRASGTETSPLRIVVYGFNRGDAFVLFNTNIAVLDPERFLVFAAGSRLVYTNASASLAVAGRGKDNEPPPDLSLSAIYHGPTHDEDVGRKLLNPLVPIWPVTTDHPLQQREDPFLAFNNRHTFYVTAREKLVPIWNNDLYGVMQTARIAVNTDIPRAVEKPQELRIQEPPAWAGDSNVGDAEAITRFVSEDAYIRRGLPTAGTVTFGGARIGPAGSIPEPESGQ